MTGVVDEEVRRVQNECSQLTAEIQRLRDDNSKLRVSKQECCFPRLPCMLCSVSLQFVVNCLLCVAYQFYALVTPL